MASSRRHVTAGPPETKSRSSWFSVDVLGTICHAMTKSGMRNRKMHVTPQTSQSAKFSFSEKN